MSDILTKIFLFIGLIIILIPFTYLWHFFIEHLPQKYGYFKFVIIVVCYLSIMGLSTLLISEGMIGLIIFFTIPILMLLIGALFFKNEIKNELKHELKWELKGLINDPD
jgi:drug/metabolite transporter (DMT)-like permease